MQCQRFLIPNSVASYVSVCSISPFGHPHVFSTVVCFRKTVAVLSHAYTGLVQMQREGPFYSGISFRYIISHSAPLLCHTIRLLLQSPFLTDMLNIMFHTEVMRPPPKRYYSVQRWQRYLYRHALRYELHSIPPSAPSPAHSSI